MLTNACFPGRSPGILLSGDGPYIGRYRMRSCPWKQPLVPGASKETPKKITPIQDEQRDFQPKGHPGCLSWNECIWGELSAKTKIRFSRSVQLPRWWPLWVGIKVKSKNKRIRELLVGKPIVILHPNSVIIWKQSSERESNNPEVN